MQSTSSASVNTSSATGASDAGLRLTDLEVPKIAGLRWD